MNKIIDIVKAFITKMNEQGFPLPMIRSNGKASLTATMTFISFNTCIFGQLGKVAGFFGGVDLTQAAVLFGICLSAYLGRKYQDKNITLEQKESDNGKEK